jgi:carbonic anhydrase
MKTSWAAWNTPKVAGSRLVVVLGHTSCGAVKGACDDVKMGNLTGLLGKTAGRRGGLDPGERNSHNHAFVGEVTELNVKQVVQRIRNESPVLKALEDEGKIRIVGALRHQQRQGDVVLNAV